LLNYPRSLRYGRYKRKPAVSEGVISKDKTMQQGAFKNFLTSDKIKQKAIIWCVRHLQRGKISVKIFNM
jgi:hypothetical protein